MHVYEKNKKRLAYTLLFVPAKVMCLFAVKMTPAVVMICPKRKSYLKFLSNLFSIHIWICNDIKSFGLTIQNWLLVPGTTNKLPKHVVVMVGKPLPWY